LKFDNLPSLLFKYFEVNNYSISNLEQDTIWLSDPRNFNDPYDYSFTIKYELDPDSPDFLISLAQEACLLKNKGDGLIEKIKNSNSPLVVLMEYIYPDKPELGQAAGRVLAQIMRQQRERVVFELSEGMKPTFLKIRVRY